VGLDAVCHFGFDLHHEQGVPEGDEESIGQLVEPGDHVGDFGSFGKDVGDALYADLEGYVPDA